MKEERFVRQKEKKRQSFLFLRLPSRDNQLTNILDFKVKLNLLAQ